MTDQTYERIREKADTRVRLGLPPLKVKVDPRRADDDVTIRGDHIHVSRADYVDLCSRINRVLRRGE